VQLAADCRAVAERKRRLLNRLSQLPRGDAFPLQVVLWRMGDAFWLGVQGESYSLLQTELRRRFSGTPIIVASVAADWGASYLPPSQLYGQGVYQSLSRSAAGSWAVDRVGCHAGGGLRNSHVPPSVVLNAQ
jgi:hypothetical protein